MADDLRTIAERTLNSTDGGSRETALRLATFALAVLGALHRDQTDRAKVAEIERASRER